MFEELGLENWTPAEAALLLGAALGLLFGALAQRSRFCLRRALAGEGAQDRRAALGVWLTALAVAMAGMQIAAFNAWIDLEETRFAVEAADLGPLVGGGLLFGAGMVLTRGCASRLTVLAASGNLRALLCVLVFAIVAHATMKGALHPLQALFAGLPVEAGTSTLDQLTGLPGWALAALTAAAAALAAIAGRARPGALVMGALIGALVPLGWVGTGFVLLDEFDPIAMESLAFTKPAADALFWVLAATAVPAGFGAGFFGGVILGAFLAAAVFAELRFETFGAPRQAGRYMLGAAMMGVGGVTAGGCTVGAGLAGIPTLGLAAPLALGGVVVGALAMRAGLALSPRTGGGGAAAIPAE